MGRKKSRAKDSVEPAKKRPRGGRRAVDPKRTRSEREADQFQQMDGVESTYFKKG